LLKDISSYDKIYQNEQKVSARLLFVSRKSSVPLGGRDLLLKLFRKLVRQYFYCTFRAGTQMVVPHCGVFMKTHFGFCHLWHFSWGNAQWKCYVLYSMKAEHHKIMQ